MMVHSKVYLQFIKNFKKIVWLNLINQLCVSVGVELKESTALTFDSGFRQHEPSCTHSHITLIYRLCDALLFQGYRVANRS